MHSGTSLHQRAVEHIEPVIFPLASTIVTNTVLSRKTLTNSFPSLKKCNNELDCLVHEMLLNTELTPSVNVQLDSIRLKVFACHLHTDMLIFSELFLTVFYNNHFELEKGLCITKP